MIGSHRILGLDLGASTIKVGEFEVTKGQGLRLTNFNHADLGIDPEHEENRKALLISTIRNVLREKDIKRSKTVFSVSGQSVFTRFVKLPPVDQSKVVQIIQYEAQQNVPFPIEEVCWDYQLIGSNAQGELEVVLFAIKNNIIEDLHDAVASAGLKTSKVDVAPMALYNAIRYNYGDLDGCTVMLDIGARTTNLLFIEQSKLFSRSIPIAGNAITQSIAAEFNVPFLDAEQIKKTGFVALGGAYEEPEDERLARTSKIIRNIMTRLHAEVARSINFYRSQQGGSAPARLMLSGGSSIIPYTDRFFQEKMSVPIEYFNPFRNVELANEIPREDLAGCAHFFGEVVGLGLRELTECPIEVNLLPTSLRSKQAGDKKRPYLVGVALALVLLPLAWWGYTARVTKLQRQQLDNVREQITMLNRYKGQIEDEQRKVNEIGGKARQILALVDQSSLWPALLQDISSRVVTGLYLRTLTPQNTAAMSPAMPTPGMGGGRPGRGEMLSPMIQPPAPISNPSPTPGSQAGGAEIRITGIGEHHSTAEDLNKVKQFADALSNSTYFDKNSITITRLPDPMLRDEDKNFDFSINARLAPNIKL